MVIYLTIGFVLSMVFVFMGMSDLYYTYKYSKSIYNKHFLMSGFIGWGALVIGTISLWPLLVLSLIIGSIVWIVNRNKTPDGFWHI